MFWCCRPSHYVLKKILSLWYSKEPVLYQHIDGNVTVIESVSLDRTITKYKIWDTHASILSHLEASNIIETDIESPWLYVGAESSFGHKDMTNTFESYLVYGNTITPTLLKKRHPLYSDWKCLDPLTFKEVEFPDEGITIDDPQLERLTKESKED